MQVQIVLALSNAGHSGRLGSSIYVRLLLVSVCSL